MRRHAGSLTFRENCGEGKLKKMNLSSSPNPFAGIFFSFFLFFFSFSFSFFFLSFLLFLFFILPCFCAYVSLCLCFSPIHCFFLDKWMLKSGQEERAYCTTEPRRCVNESRGGRPGLPVPNRPYGFCGRKATLNSNLLLI